MNPGKITIEGNAIVLQAPSAVEIQSAVKDFKRLFKCRPRIRIRGYFAQPELKNKALDSLNLINEFHEVLTVGRLYVTVDLGAGLGVESFDPTWGKQCQVRLLLAD